MAQVGDYVLPEEVENLIIQNKEGCSTLLELSTAMYHMHGIVLVDKSIGSDRTIYNIIVEGMETAGDHPSFPILFRIKATVPFGTGKVELLDD